MKTRNTRFLIDKIDNKLGSVEKELKFDKIIILVGLGCMILSAFVMGITINSHPALAVASTLVFMFGMFLAYAMVKEYYNDLKKYNSQKAKGE